MLSASISETVSPQHRVIPAFGWHPWFSYQMFFESDYENSSQLTSEQKLSHYQQVLTPTSGVDDHLAQSLPEPTSFEHFLRTLEEHLLEFPLALVGEVGLDKSFRIPMAWIPEQLEQRDPSLTPGGREGRTLTPFRVDLGHQRRILLAQLALGGKHRRAASVHGVQAHGILYETLASLWKGHERPSKAKRRLKKNQAAISPKAFDSENDHKQELPFPPRICLHSYSGPAEAVKQYTAPRVPCDIYFSFSVTINAWSESGDGKVESAVRAVPDDRVLIESDLHTAGDDMDDYLRQVAEKICSVKSWELDAGVTQLARNWKRFVTGHDGD